MPSTSHYCLSDLVNESNIVALGNGQFYESDIVSDKE